MVFALVDSDMVVTVGGVFDVSPTPAGKASATCWSVNPASLIADFAGIPAPVRAAIVAAFSSTDSPHAESTCNSWAKSPLSNVPSEEGKTPF